MDSTIRSNKLFIEGMTCANCENKIEKRLNNTAGVQKAKVSYSSGTAEVKYDTDIISLRDITNVINNLDYKVVSSASKKPVNKKRVVGLMILIVALYAILEGFGILNLLSPSQLADTNMGYGMLFVIGLITSVHCVAMCGGINISQCIPKQENVSQSKFSALMPSFLYNLGRVISYTVVGFIVGGMGSVIVFSPTAQGILKLVAGLFMIIMGINMLDIFPWLRKFNPTMPKWIVGKVNKKKSYSKSPLIIGLLNGLMPCGPLQAMQIYALSTGSPIKGSISMLLFSLGTIPLMFGLGALSSLLTKKNTKKVMTAGAVLVVVLGLSMMSQGWSLSGFAVQMPISKSSNVSPNVTPISAKIEDGVQVVNSKILPNKYPTITVKAGQPVKWIIDAPDGSINGCNYRMLMSEYNIDHTFEYGENIIEFTPTNVGTFKYSCWMGMIRGTINVVDQETEITETVEADGPIPANVKIPTENIVIAELITEGDSTAQTVSIDMGDNGYSPAIMVVQNGVDVNWNINNVSENNTNPSLLVPDYYTEIYLEKGENALSLLPSKSFAFSDSGNKFYGYVKVVDDINKVDIEAIKQEVAEYQTMIYPVDTFQPSGGGCCAGM